MKRTFLFLALTTIVATTGAKAQSQGYSDHYTPYLAGTNGFRTVAEENALMEQEMAERRKRWRKEEGITEAQDQERARQEHLQTVAVKKSAIQPKNTSYNKRKA